MTATLTIDEIRQELKKAGIAFNDYCSSLPDTAFFYQPPGKWSPAQQVKHLIEATNMARLVFALPKLIVRWYAGKPNRSSRTYDQLVDKYKSKLEQGGKASGRYIPKPISASYGKQKLLTGFEHSMNRMQQAIKRNWKEPQPDQYIAPHPLLGKITLRELGYFTIHHTYHHLENIKRMTAVSATA